MSSSKEEAMTSKQKRARVRALTILRVRKGQMTAKAAAAELGVSRKTYYQWERRGLEGMLQALEDREPGRPTEAEDPEKEQLLARVTELEAKLEEARAREALREALKAMEGRGQPRPSHGEQKKENR